MYTEYCENTLSIETIECVSTINHLIDVGVCALAGYTNFIVLHINYFKKIFSVNFWVLKFDVT